jgi:hypothetical protein
MLNIFFWLMFDNICLLIFSFYSSNNFHLSIYYNFFYYFLNENNYHKNYFMFMFINIYILVNIIILMIKIFYNSHLNNHFKYLIKLYLFFIYVNMDGEFWLINLLINVVISLFVLYNFIDIIYYFYNLNYYFV